MAVYTGKDVALKVSGTAVKINSFDFSQENKVKAAPNSLSSGYDETAAGTGSWTLNFTVLLDDTSAFPTITVGSLYTVQAFSALSLNKYVLGSVRVKTIGDSYPVDGNQLAAKISCIGHGAPTIAL